MLPHDPSEANFCTSGCVNPSRTAACANSWTALAEIPPVLHFRSSTVHKLLSGASGGASGASGACGAPPSGLILFSLCWIPPLILSLRTCTTTISGELLRKELHKYSSSQSRLRHCFASCQPVGAEIIEFSLCLSLSGLALLHPQPLHSGLQLWVQLLLISLGRQWLGHSEKQIRPGDLTQHHAGSGQSRIAPLEGPVGKLLGKS